MSENSNRLIIRNSWAVTMDPLLGEVEAAEIVIEDGVIVSVSPEPDVDLEGTIIDATGMIALPGFVDSHTHLWQTAVRGAAAETLGGEYQANVKRLRDSYTAEDKRLSAHVGAMDALAAGTTTVLDHCHDIADVNHALASAQGLRDAGIRAIFAPSMNPRRGSSSHDDRLRTIDDVRDALRDDPLVTAGISLTDAPFVIAAGDRWEWNRIEADFARERDMPMTVHTGSVTDQITALHRLGVLGPDLLPSHSRDFSAHEFDLVAAAGMAVNVTPLADLRHGLFWHVGEAMRRGLTVTVGTDGPVFGAMGMLGQLRLLVETQRANDMLIERMQGRGERRRPGVPGVTAHDVLRAATIDGARALGIDALVGSLTPGKRADIVLLRTAPFGRGRTSPTVHVLTDDRVRVDTVLVDGAVRLRGGVPTEPGHAALVERLDAASDRIFATPLDGVRRVWWAPPAEAALWDRRGEVNELGEDLGTAAAERN